MTTSPVPDGTAPMPPEPTTDRGHGEGGPAEVVSTSAVRSFAWLALVLDRVLAANDAPSLAHYRLLFFIDSGRDQASRIAAQLALARPTISAAVDSLVTQGFLERAPVEDDRRAVRLTVTTAGRAEIERADAAIKARFAEYYAEVDDLAAPGMPSAEEIDLAFVTLIRAMAAVGARRWTGAGVAPGPAVD